MKQLFFFFLITISIFPQFNKIDISFSSDFYSRTRYTEILEGNNSSTVLSDNKYKNFDNIKSFKLDTYENLLKVETNYLDIGYGFRLENSVKTQSPYSNLNYFMPVYFSCLYQKYNKNVNFYSKFNFGYEFAIDKKNEIEKYNGYEKAKLTGGLYFGIETGIEYKNILLGLVYSQTSTKLLIPEGLNQDSKKIDIDYSTVALLLGYRFE